jgi:sulfane dehydrogenase subunit SoxC
MIAHKGKGNVMSEQAEEVVAGGGLLHRRTLLGFAAAMGAAGAARAADPVGQGSPPSMLKPGRGFETYGLPSEFEKPVAKAIAAGAGRPGTGVSRTPLHLLEGTITPAGLHFERHHNGIPDIDPAKHELLIHGLVERPLVFTRETLARYPMETRIHFVECAGNTGGNAGPGGLTGDVTALYGLLSNSEWTGVPLKLLLDEAGVKKEARWVLAEGADPAGMSRSVPISICMDDAMVALYQNGEAIRPANGYPMRLLLPGCQGNANVKWLRRLKAVPTPVNTKDETSKYSLLLPDGRAEQFHLEFGPKSVILKPSPGLTMKGAGHYEISGLAWTGGGKVRKVEVSADGGRSWAQAALTGPVLSKAATRFRMPWRWDGSPATLLSRATDQTGAVQPTRTAWLAQYGAGQGYHYNAIQSWAVAANRTVTNVYL